MTRKDYVKIAAALAVTKPVEPAPNSVHTQWNIDVMHIADVLQADNPRFDRSRFLKAAGVL